MSTCSDAIRVKVRVMVFNTTFHNISAILWRSVLLVNCPFYSWPQLLVYGDICLAFLIGIDVLHSLTILTCRLFHLYIVPSVWQMLYSSLLSN